MIVQGPDDGSFDNDKEDTVYSYGKDNKEGMEDSESNKVINIASNDTTVAHAAENISPGDSWPSTGVNKVTVAPESTKNRKSHKLK